MNERDRDKTRDFLDLNQAEPQTPPARISNGILARVHADLHPSSWKVFSKLALIHLITAVFTLSACPQFEIRIFGEGMGLLHYFMRLGPYGCMVACGSFFIGSSILIASLMFYPEEIRVLRKNRVLQLATLTLLSLGFFIMLGATDIILGFALTWIAGSLLGGWLTLELGCLLRLRH